MSVKIVIAEGPQRDAAYAIRRAVFMDEQGVSEAEEFDAYDADALHLLALGPDGEPAGTARLRSYEGWAKLERIAVLAAWRGHGVGKRLVEALLSQARAQGLRRHRLNAQCQALDFYRGFGFEPVGEVFLDAGIDHREMRLIDAAAGP